MASRLFPSLHLSLFFFFFYFLLPSPSLADGLPSSSKVPITPYTACISTPFPNFCKSILSSHGDSNLRDYGLFSIKRSLKSATKFSSLVDRYLKLQSSLPKTTVRALEDCHLLSRLNIDFLLSAATTLNLNSTNGFLSIDTEDVQTLLSAIITNQQTCLEGLQAAAASSVQSGLYTPLFNDTKLYRVSLALFTRAFVHKKKKRGRVQPRRGRKLFSNMNFRRDGVLPLRISGQNRKVFELRSGRRLLQSSLDNVLISDIVVVGQDGSANFTSIKDAVAAAPNNTDISDGYFLIFIAAGVYEEYVSIPKNNKNLMMIGDGINQTIVTGNRSFVDGWTTFNSATFAVVGEGFVAINMTFRNTAGAVKHQAVAVRNGADFSAFYSCSFEGYQDTLYTHSFRQFYKDSDIYGTIDFIFGNAAVVFQNCNLYARLPLPSQINAFTAQGRTDPNQNTGISIQNCTVTAAPELASFNGTAKAYLGRPWKQFSRTVYLQSFIDGLIDPTGWLPWDGDFALSTLFYGEYGNMGSGSSTNNRVTWPGYHVLSAPDVSNFTVSNFIYGDFWLPATGVPFEGGLL
ncbi:putative pectinesterase/pectinesterase inhibitor 41 [Cinnamomum micranthum f. kanehirae]|uniref:Pectinesterase n=1 Tax=Cinnamomum micranthum f. kanehirae TaxID=337451 RepID=A0A443NDC9_9MAGN|nr:putative pectinesterase/pectinesterase inhibitor 41 [Cinnamomum micranthum f. kanehirae]